MKFLKLISSLKQMRITKAPTPKFIYLMVLDNHNHAKAQNIAERIIDYCFCK